MGDVLLSREAKGDGIYEEHVVCTLHLYFGGTLAARHQPITFKRAMFQYDGTIPHPTVLRKQFLADLEKDVMV